MATVVKLAIREFGLLKSKVNNASVVIGANNSGSNVGNDDGNVIIDQGSVPDTSTTSSSSTASATSTRATSPLPAISDGTPSSTVVTPTSASSKSVTEFQSLPSNSPPTAPSTPESSLPPESSSSIPTHLSSGVASPKGHKAVSTAAIAGSVVGSIVVLIIASFCLFCFLRRRRARNQLSPSQLITAFATTETPIKLPRTTGHIIPAKVSRSMGLTPDYNLAEFESRLLPAYGAGIMAHMSNPPVPTGSVVGSEIDNAEPVATRLESMQNLITQIMGHVRQLETEREHDGDSVTMGSILPPPPTYASE
ncbi:hypothetical protein GYMLUDRAFT_248202 [Collybiopsis luxurians FD-317 M1]|uniref:Unplaced genomic scaffold GYMLUscaffold_53, whole genome shotgun sequence n=1 Tax=Collybiopsis luxurians FD-317 M1 TaxID=944289 RepID=A0A0D0CLH2_9AGAR|nr:hypothetical protein GYMLUDRAFT_248202 [Collybiopsis luxurians FD-317 M1]